MATQSPAKSSAQPAYRARAQAAEVRRDFARFDGESDALWTATVRFDDGARTRLVGTAEHPIYVPALGRWIELAELQVKDDLQGLGQAARVEANERAESAARVFNLAVDDTHSFCAGGVLVHNSTQPPCGRAAQGKKPRNRPPGQRLGVISVWPVLK